ncbi:anti-anti-sigma factor [Legionella lansingensis]|uniref:Anti-anti-sigma factor n=1 Tax=Legionella lansingensis TaxID=45067 RepID=A0A0W0W044_9GAMM|nr:STAS domain-containing protein [Legionella lansingensis]KTD25704.1 anti-anti-sigma factor [Legionella lansingensis]SNV49203.1 anti-anti-sigma factor [Legionella lansingensis]
MQEQSFKPSQEMTFATVVSDRERLNNYVRETKEKLIKLDLSEVAQCDSAGLALLIEAKRLSARENKMCKIDGMPKIVQALAEFCGVDAILSEC